jgi:hypothetical protein
MEELLPYLVQTNPYQGLTENDVEKAINTLNGSLIERVI